MFFFCFFFPPVYEKPGLVQTKHHYFQPPRNLFGDYPLILQRHQGRIFSGPETADIYRCEGFSVPTPTTCMPLPTFHILTRAPQCIPSQLRGGSSQMLLLKWRYVNQGNLRDYPDSHMGRTAGLGDWHTNRDGWRITCRICRVMLSFSNE